MANIAPSCLLHYSSREALLQALNDYLMRLHNIEAALRKIAEASNGIDALRASAALQARLYPKIWAVARALELSRRSDSAVEKVWQTQARNGLEYCACTIALLVRDNQLRPQLNEATATDLLWSLTSIVIWEELVLQRGWSVSRYQKHMSDLLISALTVAPLT